MSTASLIIAANQTGLGFTADLNAGLEAINTCHSGSTAPTTDLVAGKFWLDTSGANPILKIYRNGWKSLFTLNTTTVDMNVNDILANDVTLSGDLNMTNSASVIQVSSVDLGNWTVTETAGTLYFATGGTNKMKLDSSGNLVCVGNVTAYGTV